jgi:ADP-ribosylglycohydrolase
MGPSASANGALMRLVPVAIRFRRDQHAALNAAEG